MSIEENLNGMPLLWAMGKGGHRGATPVRIGAVR